MYCIYHIPGIKIGCSSEIDIRVKCQGFDSYEILEEHTDIYIASKREIELQKQYGYKIDTVPYYVTMKTQIASRNKKSRIKALKSRGKVEDVLSQMGKIGGKKNKESGKLLLAASKAWNLERSEKQKEHWKSYSLKGLEKAAEVHRKKIIATNLITGEKIKFNSVKEACFKLKSTTITACLKGRQNQSKGFKFEYEK